VKPKMLAMSSKQLIPYLGHKNGWYRSTARKLLILRNQKDIVSDLTRAFDGSEETQEKIEILWTLDGLASVDPAMLISTIKSSDSRLAVHALRVADSLLTQSHTEILKIYEEISAKSENPALLIQAFLSMKTFGSRPIANAYLTKLITKHGNNSALKLHANQWEAEKKRVREHQEFQAALKGKGPLFEKVMTKGDKHYKSLCFACHGNDGLGTPMAGTDITLAAPLAGSPRVKGDKQKLIKIALHGLTGPLDGKTYPGAMESLASHDDEYIASVLTYIRNTWGNSGRMITKKDVADVRKKNRRRKSPWTLEELNKK
jgi:mono/diheme cytochrome c family protein